MDPARLWQAVSSTIAAAARDAAEPVAALAISSHGETFVPVDAHGGRARPGDPERGQPGDGGGRRSARPVRRASALRDDGADRERHLPVDQARLAAPSPARDLPHRPSLRRSGGVHAAPHGAAGAHGGLACISLAGLRRGARRWSEELLDFAGLIGGTPPRGRPGREHRGTAGGGGGRRAGPARRGRSSRWVVTTRPAARWEWGRSRPAWWRTRWARTSA